MEDDNTQKTSLRDYMKRRMNMFLKNANITIRKTNIPTTPSCLRKIAETYDESEASSRQIGGDSVEDIRSEPLIIENITTLERRISHVERDVSSMMETVASENVSSLYRRLDDIQNELAVIHSDMDVLQNNCRRVDTVVTELNSKLETVIRSIGVIDIE